MKKFGRRKLTKHQMMLSTLALFFTFMFVSAVWVEYSEARSRIGGRSFSGSRSFSRTPSRSYSGSGMNTPRRSSSFMRGLGGGLLGGAIGSMLFGGMGHAGMGGGFGGSGIGLLEILIIGGLIYFLYKKFSGKSRSGRSPFSSSGGGHGSSGGYENVSGSPYRPPDMASGDIPDMAPGDVVAEELGTIRRYDPAFDPENFKEFAQDVFFKVQAAWTRRDISVMQQYLGSQLLSEYERHFADLKAKGQENRLENIAVRRVDIVDMGEMDGEPFVIIQFKANLLDYTVDEATGKVLEGSSSEPVKFQERWAFSKPAGSSQWKLEGIQE